MTKPCYSVILSNMGSCCDRYLSSGYSGAFSIDEMFERAASIDRLKGVELVLNRQDIEKNIESIKKNLDKTGLNLVSIIPDITGNKKWGKGALTSKDPSIRRETVEKIKQMMDVASGLKCGIINLWPGQDGYDYYFQSDYIKEREWFEEGVKECCNYRKDIKIAIEYKLKEPRNRSLPSNVTGTLLMVKEINEPNCGITVDYGHALLAYENPAESVAVLKKYGDKLFHIHMNDNYGYWDDDMMVGSVHTIPYIEFIYWLKKTGYDGWISMDQYPYREDGKQAVSESIQWFESINAIVDKMDTDKVEAVIKRGNAVEASKMLRKYMFMNMEEDL